MENIIEYDHSYANTLPGRLKLLCLALCGLGLFAFEIGGHHIGQQFAIMATWAFFATGFLFLLFVCKSSLRSSLLWLKIEIVVCAVLTIGYIFGTFETIQTTWHHLWISYNAYRLACSLATLICSLVSTVTYAYDTAIKYKDLREPAVGGITTV